MIALISSTIFPPDSLLHGDRPRSVHTSEQRLEQTRATINSLLSHGISEIFLADNSGRLWRDGTEQRLLPAVVQCFSHHQFRNKGLSEFYLLLDCIDYLPESQPILKISGRYRLIRSVGDETQGVDVAGNIGTRMMSSSFYFVRDRETFRQFMRDSIKEVYAYSARIVGPRSLLRIVRDSFKPTDYPYDDPPSIAAEMAMRLALRRGYLTKVLDIGYVEGEPGAIESATVRE